MESPDWTAEIFGFFWPCEAADFKRLTAQDIGGATIDWPLDKMETRQVAN